MAAALTRSVLPSLRRSAITASPRSMATPSIALRARTLTTTLPRMETKTRYTPEHEWVTLDTESNIGTIGITDYAQKSLGDVVYVELPSQGSEVKQGGE